MYTDSCYTTSGIYVHLHTDNIITLLVQMIFNLCHYRLYTLQNT